MVPELFVRGAEGVVALNNLPSFDASELGFCNADGLGCAAAPLAEVIGRGSMSSCKEAKSPLNAACMADPEPSLGLLPSVRCRTDEPPVEGIDAISNW